MTKRTHLMSLAAIAAFSLVNAGARADDGGSPYDNFPMTVAASGIGYAAEPATCTEANGDAWFARQLQLTDGDVDPTVATPHCRAESDVIAQAGQDESQGGPGARTVRAPFFSVQRGESHGR